MSKPLTTDNLTKQYKLGKKQGAKTALDSLSIEVPEGVIFGFLGPNGAGKTTTIKLLLDFMQPTSGSASVMGLPTSNPATRKLVGYLPEEPYFHRFLKPIEVLSMHAALAGVAKREIPKRASAVLERVGIAEYADTPISKLSKGLTQRVGIAQALIGDPKLLILDEPTSGLDPIGRRHTTQLLVDLRNEGKTIFLSSHVLSEIENVCDMVAVLKRGKLVAYGEPDKVRSEESFVMVQTSKLHPETHERLRFLDVIIEPFNDTALLKFDRNNLYRVMLVLEGLSLPVYNINTQRESLEEAFLRLAA
ncbi:MAG: ABC transporter ATP-binding protein [Armatimonadetes bacterium]|nr:ABC transporter ATP-binding protein [Armatimonadota bacterium]